MVVRIDEAASRWSAHLRVVVAGEGLPCRTLEINERRIRIGRDPHAEICLPSQSVSRIHAVLEHQAGLWILDDRESTNGTMLDGRLTEMAILRPGNVLQVGPFRIRILSWDRLLPDLPQTELRQGTARAEVLPLEDIDLNERTVKVREPV